MAILESQQLKKGVLELTITIPTEQVKPYLEKAARELQHNRPLDGFRPGKAPYETAVKIYGSMTIFEAALRYAVPGAYVEVVKENHFKTVGEPEIQVTKITPDQPVEFQAKVAIMPEVVLGDYKKIKEQRQTKIVEEAEIDKVIEELREARATKKLVERTATKNDKLVVDMTISREGVPLEGGQTKDHAIDLARPYIIDGFIEKIIGAKAGEVKKFSLPFPKNHYDKKLAGQAVDYEITIKGVYESERPELNDDFVKSLGDFKNVEELKNQIKNNLSEMYAVKENQRLERDIIDKLIKQTKFGDIPQILIEAEVRKIMARMRTEVENQGQNWEEYLQHLGKGAEDLAKSWLPEAEMRAKAALLVREIAEAEHIDVSAEEIENERKLIISHYPDEKDADIREEIKSSEYDSHLKHLVLTRKTMKFITDLATS